MSSNSREQVIPLTNPSIAPIIKALEDLFKIFNDKFFNSALLKPVITLSQKGTKSVRGWCTAEKVWEDRRAEKYYELNICPEFLKNPIEEVCETLLHEMAHLKNVIDNIPDCSSGGQYHNKNFKMSAENYGLTIEKHPRYGYSITSLKPETLEFINGLNLSVFDLFRNEQIEADAETAKKPKKSSTRTYICPKCETIIRATMDVKVRCDGCDVLFVKENSDK